MKTAEKEAIQEMYARHHYRCFVCGAEVTQRAHIISNSRMNRRIYGKIIDDPINWLPACSLACNALIDAGSNLRLKQMIAVFATSHVLEDWHYSLIEREVRKNIKRKKEKLYRIDNV